MNPLILDLVSIPLGYLKNTMDRVAQPDEMGRDFFSELQVRLPPRGKRKDNGADSSWHGLGSKESLPRYLDALKRALISEGKPLGGMYLGKEDLPLLRQFLLACGFSQVDAQRILTDITGSWEGTGISLSRFFEKIGELSGGRHKKAEAEGLRSSLIPHLESVLRALGLSPEESDRVINGSRYAGGSLDPHRLITELREILVLRKDEGRSFVAEGESAQRVAQDLEKMGIPVLVKSPHARISIEDLVAALEGMTEEKRRMAQLPDGVKALISEIVQKVSGAHGRHPSSALSASLPKTRVSRGLSKEAGAGKAKGRPGIGGNEAGAEVSHGARRIPMPEGGRVSEGHSEGRDGGSGREGTPSYASCHIARDSFSEIGHAAGSSGQGHPTASGDLPGYLMDQLNKQIVRAFLKGQRTLKLRVKPPELGVIKVEMDVKDNNMKLGMIAENGTVKDLLLAHVHELRETLMNQGLKLERVEVQINQSFGQLLGNAEDGARDGSGWRQGARAPFFLEKAEGEEIQETLARRSIITQHLLDLMA